MRRLRQAGMHLWSRCGHVEEYPEYTQLVTIAALHSHTQTSPEKRSAPPSVLVEPEKMKYSHPVIMKCCTTNYMKALLPFGWGRTVKLSCSNLGVTKAFECLGNFDFTKMTSWGRWHTVRQPNSGSPHWSMEKSWSVASLHTSLSRAAWTIKKQICNRTWLAGLHISIPVANTETNTANQTAPNIR